MLFRSGVKGVEENLNEKYMGFKKVAAAAKAGGAKDPGAVAASIGRKKYGKAAFQKAAAAGKKMGESEGDKPKTSKKMNWQQAYAHNQGEDFQTRQDRISQYEKSKGAKGEKKSIYESVEAKGSVLEGVKSVEAKLNEKYMGFKAVKKAAKKGGAENPGAVAASIGRKKYGKAAFQKAAASGKKMGEGNVDEMIDYDTLNQLASHPEIGRAHV